MPTISTGFSQNPTLRRIGDVKRMFLTPIPPGSTDRIGIALMRCGAPPVEDQNQDRLTELCEKASNEMDSGKLLELVKEINLLLDKRKTPKVARPTDR